MELHADACSDLPGVWFRIHPQYKAGLVQRLCEQRPLRTSEYPTALVNAGLPIQTTEMLGHFLALGVQGV